MMKNLSYGTIAGGNYGFTVEGIYSGLLQCRRPNHEVKLTIRVRINGIGSSGHYISQAFEWHILPR